MSTTFHEFDYNKTAVLNPGDFTKPVDGFPEICVSTFSEEIINKFAAMDQVEVVSMLYSANGALPVYKINYKGKNIAFYLSRVGAPACAAGFEEIIAMGAKKMVLFGCCGVLDNEAVQDRIIVPTSAVRDEGTSYHYLPENDEIPADDHTTNVLVSCLEKYGYPYVTGKIWTTDAIYRETPDKIEDKKNQGCIGVEMEYSAMLAVSQFRNIPFVQFLFGADSLDENGWEIGDLLDYGLTGAEKYMAIALECGIKL